jgi:hypothetical protein
MKIKYFLLVLLFLSIELTAQWNFSLSTSQSYSDNPFNSPLPVSTFVSSIDVGIERDFKSLSFGFYGDYTSFHDIPERNFYWYQVGSWSATESSIFGIYLEQRINSVEYELYDYSNYNTYYKQKFSLVGLNLLGNIALSYTNFNSLENLDNILGSVGFSLNKSFETKTTVIGGINFNYKNYVSTDLNSKELVGDSLHSSSDNAFTSQINSYVKIAQSIAESTGLAIQYSSQAITSGTANYIRELDYRYGDESQYFDDPISYQGDAVSVQLTQILPESIMLKLIYTYASKEYPSQGIYLDIEYFDDSIIRSDERNQFDFTISKYFYVGNDNQNVINLALSYSWIKNNSNSYWYNFNSNQINLFFDYQF